MNHCSLLCLLSVIVSMAPAKAEESIREDRPHSLLGSGFYFGPRIGVFGVTAMFPTSAILTGGIAARLQSERGFIGTAIYFLIPIDPVPSVEYVRMSARYPGFAADLGAGLRLASRNIAPYVGAGLVPRLLWSEEGAKGKFNLALYGSAGISFWHHLFLEFRVTQSATPLRLVSEFGTSNHYYSTEVGANLGVEF